VVPLSTNSQPAAATRLKTAKTNAQYASFIG
jgi:hypothetical protein